jgi:hypothetical protein
MVRVRNTPKHYGQPNIAVQYSNPSCGTRKRQRHKSCCAECIFDDGPATSVDGCRSGWSQVHRCAATCARHGQLRHGQAKRTVRAVASPRVRSRFRRYAKETAANALGWSSGPTSSMVGAPPSLELAVAWCLAVAGRHGAMPVHDIFLGPKPTPSATRPGCGAGWTGPPSRTEVGRSARPRNVAPNTGGRIAGGHCPDRRGGLALPCRHGDSRPGPVMGGGCPIRRCRAALRSHGRARSSN